MPLPPETGSQSTRYSVPTTGASLWTFGLPLHTPLDKDDCKDGGWQDLTDENGRSFRNQGECVARTNQNL